MRFTITTALLALASSVVAQTPGFDVISKPTKGEVIPAGSTYVIDWEPSTNWTGPVTIDLLGGPDQGGLQPLSVLAKGVDSNAGEYSWAVDKALGTQATYGLRITLDSDPTTFQYSFPFVIKASGDSTSSSSSTGSGSSSSSTTTAAPSTSSTSSSSSDTTETTLTTISTSMTTSAPTGGNLSTTGSPTKTHATTTTTGKSNPTGTTVPANPGAVVRASTLALVGGFALAIFAL
ncbi:hypothetical protein NKR19_g6245 [Coniochaeta hoffmannii]|uniref:Yeast cell wall synthesis Kre9/Knh1-like N-terminal domain-containing protein n=1 Tax=Coniochaeta hoffmannii TaxID=91930 RepID=A0AA38RRW9_9PEZI|nr:hypothetical protein NKR19_g6245 [Coniochaeta hoffmannii]